VWDALHLQNTTVQQQQQQQQQHLLFTASLFTANMYCGSSCGAAPTWQGQLHATQVQFKVKSSQLPLLQWWCKILI
jgi:hypothetical protein